MVSAKTDMVTLKGRTDVAHIPYQPFWLLIVRGVQLLLALLIMALSAYAGSGYYFGAGYGVGIFSFVWTLIFICYIEITTFYAPAAYNKYAHLVLEILSVIFWLSTFASLAVLAAAWDFSYGLAATCYGYGCIKLRARSDGSGPVGATKAAAALGAIEWVLFCGTLITFGIYLHRNRRDTLEARHAGITGNAVVEEHKMGTVTTHQPVYQQQQQTGYNQQQQHQQSEFTQQPTGYAQPTGYSQVPVDPRYGNNNMA